MHPQNINERALWRDDDVTFQPSGPATVKPSGIEERPVAPSPLGGVQKVRIFRGGNDQ